jgi:TolB-like protein/Flp pilus assembly protein TadD
MKRCPECGREYDNTMMFCLDDGAELLYGPASADELPTKLLRHERPSRENETQLLNPHSDPKPAITANRRLWPVVIAFGVILVAAVLVGTYKYYSGVVRQPNIRSLAVLPLENLSGDPEQEYFADGMTETLIGNLSQIRSLTVTSRRSVMRFKGNMESVSEIAGKLGVDAVIEGTVQRSDGRIKISTQLVLASNNAPIWSRSYESDLKDVLKLQSDVARAIASEVNVKLTPGEQNRLDSAKSIDPKAHEAYLLGTYHLGKQNEKDLSLAIGYFEEASKIAPDFADAYAGLSRAWSKRGIWGSLSLLQVDSAARAAAEKALELDPNNSSAHVALVSILMNRDNDWSRAESEAKRAIELDPGNAEAYIALSWVLQCLGRHAEVVPNMEMAKRLDPISTQLESDYGRMLYRARNNVEAEAHLKRSIELDPNNFSAYGRLADVYLQMERFEDAIAYCNKAKEMSPDRGYDLRLATVYARMGKRKEALQIISQATNVRSMGGATVYAALGDNDQAFKLLNEAVDGNDALLSNAKEDPGLEPLHNDPRWKEFLRRMKFPDS